MEKNWSELTREQKREIRMKDWLAGTGINFRDAHAEKMYKERVNRQKKVMMCEIPDRVPVQIPSANFPAYYSGYDLKRVMNDYEALEKSWIRFMNDFYDDMDNFMGPGFVHSAPAMEIIDYRSYKWPGHGLGDNVNAYQFVEEPIMEADEYDALLRDPSDFSFRVLLPRTVGTLKPLANFPALPTLLFLSLMVAYPFADPNMRAAFQSLIKAGEELEKWQKHVGCSQPGGSGSGISSDDGCTSHRPFRCDCRFPQGDQGGHPRHVPLPGKTLGSRRPDHGTYHHTDPVNGQCHRRLHRELSAAQGG